MLTHCPECNYDLRGLPADHTCPECGLKYDADCVLARVEFPKAIWLGFAGYVFGGLVIARLPFLPGGGPFTSTSGFRISFIFLIVFYAVMGWRLRKVVLGMYRRGAVAAVLPEYLLIYPAEFQGARIPWADISRAAANKGTRTVTVFLRRSRSVRDIKDAFATGADCEAFAAAINRRVAALQTSSDDP